MEKLVRESLFEKFSEDGDPIADMGIGGYSFSKLKVGAIITTKVPKISLKRNNDGYFTYPGKGIDLPIDMPLLVVSVRDYIIPRTKEIYIYKETTDIDKLMEIRQSLKDNNFKGRWGTKVRMIINEKKFERMFKVLERGF